MAHHNAQQMAHHSAQQIGTPQGSSGPTAVSKPKARDGGERCRAVEAGILSMLPPWRSFCKTFPRAAHEEAHEEADEQAHEEADEEAGEPTRS